MKQLYTIQITPGVCFDALANGNATLRPGTKVIVNCEHYQDLAIVKAPSGEPFDSPEILQELQGRQTRGRHIAGHTIPEILRLADEGDVRRAANNAHTAEAMHRKTAERIQAHNLGMRLIQTHYTLDTKLLLCQFTAESRVDFRALLQDLAALFHTRIELRQVGVRDEAAIIGGVGACGRPYCCATFLHSIASVNVRMAKQQGISLTPQNISGACGRLKCCLQFEQPLHQHEAQPEQEANGDTAAPNDAKAAQRRNSNDFTANRSGNHGKFQQSRQNNQSRPQPQQRTKPQANANPPRQGSNNVNTILPLRTNGIVPLTKKRDNANKPETL